MAFVKNWLRGYLKLERSIDVYKRQNTSFSRFLVEDKRLFRLSHILWEYIPSYYENLFPQNEGKMCIRDRLDDGRVVYTRWDYNDRGQVWAQPLFQMNPDGTGQAEYYGRCV